MDEDIKEINPYRSQKKEELNVVFGSFFLLLWKVKMLDEELLKCYNLKHNYRAKYLQNKQKKEKRNEICCDFKTNSR